MIALSAPTQPEGGAQRIPNRQRRGVYSWKPLASMRSKSSAAIFGKDRAAGEQPAKSEQQEARLAEGDVPENARSLVARVLAERAARRVVHEIDQAAVVRLLELMNRLANQLVEIELAPQR